MALNRSLVVFLGVMVFAAGNLLTGAASAAGEHPYDQEILAFEQQDHRKPPPSGAVLFVGSSSITLWPRLQAAFPEKAIIQRGFGGATLADVAHFATRIVIPYRPRVVVLYAGENDVAAGKRAEAIVADLKRFVYLIHQDLPATEIIVLAIKPSVKRASLASAIKEANMALRSFTASDPRLRFVDIYTPMTNPTGDVRPELFVEDGLHMNAAGYAIWRSALAPALR